MVSDGQLRLYVLFLEERQRTLLVRRVQKRVLSQLQGVMAQGHDLQRVQNLLHHERGRRKVHDFRQGQEIQTVSQMQILGVKEPRL
jgi:hypothetical protein